MLNSDVERFGGVLGDMVENHFSETSPQSVSRNKII